MILACAGAAKDNASAATMSEAGRKVAERMVEHLMGEG
jgi:hypothetical protein